MTTDLRVQKTKGILKETFKEMFMDMDYVKITIKALCEKALINRRTFYLHYNSIDDLLSEILEEMARDFYEFTSGYDHFANPDKMVRDYFIFASTHPFFEKINNNIYYDYMREMINNKVSKLAYINFSSIMHHDDFTKRMIATYLNSATVNMYRIWCLDKKSVPIETAIEIAILLIKKGINSVTK